MEEDRMNDVLELYYRQSPAIPPTCCSMNVRMTHVRGFYAILAWDYYDTVALGRSRQPAGNVCKEGVGGTDPEQVTCVALVLAPDRRVASADVIS